eukprot:CAMPEP_0194295098 /NCGR_PEP_ID=MMETSP0169-20130528/52591_1 /TAXON_ID=218684 /ORGANISM="Corethron pennatum, Strain L29A3" /LENGTH=352 /DNA_ID=CAMNT_0039044197 /DNA_START=13 /DNA_END=1071 /DNA_ORIENTATION=+
MANNRPSNASSGGGGVASGSGSGGNGTMNEHVEFTVKAEENLFLTGTRSTIQRVVAETNYSCLMLKTQRFSSLFRHYAKYHGLRKDDLEYYFVNPLENEDTPESVQLQRGDTIMVRKRRGPAGPEGSPSADGTPPPPDEKDYFTAMRGLMENREHTDVVFETAGGGDGVRAHRCILAARGEFFKVAFRTGPGGGQPQEGADEFRIAVGGGYGEETVKAALEFVYCNRLQVISDFTVDELLDLLGLAERWMLRDLKRLCEFELMRLMDTDNVARMYCATEEHKALRLSNACISFIMDNIRDVAGNDTFRTEMRHYPHLCIPVLKAAADLIPEPDHKRQRRRGEATASPVPSDT